MYIAINNPSLKVFWTLGICLDRSNLLAVCLLKISPNNIQNTLGEECTVVIENIVLSSDEIYYTKVLQNHPRTTTKNPLAFDDAKKIAKQIKYSADSNAKEYEKDIQYIKFEVK